MYLVKIYLSQAKNITNTKTVSLITVPKIVSPNIPDKTY
jgi:hypothetical protein